MFLQGISPVSMFVDAPFKVTRRTKWVAGVEVLDVAYYMKLEREYRASYDEEPNEFGECELPPVPDYFNPAAKGDWQTSDQDTFDRYVDFDEEQYRQHGTIELHLRSVEKAPTTFCVKGCTTDCTMEVDGHGRWFGPTLYRQYYLHPFTGTSPIAVSQKPTDPYGEGYIDCNGRFMITDAAFKRRKESLIAHYKWKYQMEYLERCNLPHIIAGPEPELSEPQETFDEKALPAQYCGGLRNGVIGSIKALDPAIMPGFLRVVPDGN